MATWQTAPLGDLSNRLEQGPSSSKRRRTGDHEQPVSRFIAVLESGGCTGLDADLLTTPPPPASAGGSSSTAAAAAPPDEPLMVADPRQLRRALTTAAATPEGAATLAEGFAAALSSPRVLRQLLLPLTVTRQHSAATGDSLARLLLHTLPLQQQVATLLLQKLPEWGAGEGSLPQLVLGQLRWLEVVVDPPALTATVLEVLPVCTPQAQQQLIGFLPEVATPQEHEAVVSQLLLLLESDLAFVAAVLDCLGNMQLEEGLQLEVSQQLLQLLPAVAVEDLAPLVRYLVAGCSGGGGGSGAAAAAGGGGGGGSGAAHARAVVDKLRELLHFVAPADPRLPVPDLKQKGPAPSSSRVAPPEASVVQELGLGLGQSPAAAAAWLQQLGALTAPNQHRTVDLVVLLLLLRGGGTHGKSAEALLRHKLMEGQATTSWLTKAVQGHQAMLKDCWQVLLRTADSWAGSKAPTLAAAAGELYCGLFQGWGGGCWRQELLQELHGHLGSGVGAKEDVALQVLCRLARCCRPLLSSYGSFLSNILDHLDGFSDTQLSQVFEMLVTLTQPLAGNNAGSSTGNTAAGSSSTGGGSGGGGRLQDELLITLTKAQSHPLVKYKRIAIIGGLALLWHAADAVAAAAEAHEEVEGAALAAWTARAGGLFDACRDSPPCMAFLMDQLTARLQQPAAAGGGSGGGGAGPAAGGGCAAAAGVGDVFGRQLPGPCLEFLAETVYEMVASTLLGDLNSDVSSLATQAAAQGPGEQLLVQLQDPLVTQGCTWFNLDGAAAPVYCRLGELALSEDPRTRAQLVWAAPALALLAQLQLLQQGDLSGIDALLGCPVLLPVPGWYLMPGEGDRAGDAGDGAGDVGWEELPAASKGRVMAALFYAVAWWREGLNAFAGTVRLPEVVPQSLHGTQNQQQLALAAEMHAKVLARCSQLAVLEALLQQLVAGDGAVAAAALPDLRQPLTAGEQQQQQVGVVAVGGAAAGRQERSISPAEALRRQRPLALPAQQALCAVRPHHLAATRLAPAAYLMGDLAAKLKALLAARPLGLIGAAAGAGSQLPAIPGPSGSDPAAVLGQLVPLLPLLEDQLQLAVGQVREPAEGGQELLIAELPGFADIFPQLTRATAVAGAMHQPAVARAAALSGLQVFTLLLQHQNKGPPGFLAELLAALAGTVVPPADQAGGGGGMQQLVPAAFAAAVKLSCLNSKRSDLQLERAVLGCMTAVAGAAAGAGGLAGGELQDLRAQVAQGAADLLKESWVPEGEAEEEGKSFSWKGHSADIGDLLQLLVRQSDAPAEVLLGLVRGPLAAVPGKVATRRQLDAVEGWAALCSATFLVWYRVLFQELSVEFESLVAAALKLVERGGAAKRRGKGAAAAAEGDDPWDDEQASVLIPSIHHCAAAFTRLVHLTRTHQQRTGVLNQALKWGGKFVVVFVKVLPFWRVAFQGYQQEFRSLIKEVQKGTKVLQSICNEGKVRRGASLVNHAPTTKKALEGFIQKMREFTCELGIGDLFWLGQLKHRDLSGNYVGSQMFPEEVGDEEAAESAEEEEEDGAADEAMEEAEEE